MVRLIQTASERISGLDLRTRILSGVLGLTITIVGGVTGNYYLNPSVKILDGQGRAFYDLTPYEYDRLTAEFVPDASDKRDRTAYIEKYRKGGMTHQEYVRWVSILQAYLMRETLAGKRLVEFRNITEKNILKKLNDWLEVQK